jgi:son of sevenless-like protein
MDFDSRYQEDSRKEIVAEMYLKFVDKVLEDEDTITNFSDAALLDTAACVLWILRNCNKESLIAWWKELPFTLQTNAFLLLENTAIVYSMLEEVKVRKEVLLIILDVAQLLVELTRPIIDRIKQENIVFDEEDEGEDEGEKPPQNPAVHVMMDKMCKFFKNLIMTSRFQSERSIIYRLFCSLIPFIKAFIGDIVVTEIYTRPKVSRMLREKYEARWRTLLGAVLAHCELPKEQKTHPIICECIKLLTSPYWQEGEIKLDTNDTSSETDIIMGDGLIKAATLEKLIERLLLGGKDNEKFFNRIFLLTYYSFTTPLELLKHLMAAYKKYADDNTVQLKLLNFVGDWVKESFHNLDNYVVAMLVTFMDDEQLTQKHRVTQTKIRKYVLKQLLQQKTAMNQHENMNRPPVQVPKNFDMKKHEKPKIPIEHMLAGKVKKNLLGNPFDYPFDLLEWPSVEIARQMTLIEADLFRKIEPKECFGLAWSKNKDMAPNLVQISERFNNVNNWVQRTILNEQDLKRRQQLLQKFIEIIKELRELNNFTSINQICSALNSASIHRLTKTWEVLTDKEYKLFKELGSLFENPPYKELRKELQKCSGNPAIPFIGMFQTELTFIEDGNKDFLENKEGKQLIHFSKRRLYSDTIMNIQLYQQTPYNLTPLPYLEYIFNHEIFMDNFDENNFFILFFKL